MNKLLLFVSCVMAVAMAHAQTIDLSKYVWKKTATTYPRRVNGVDNQGGGYYDGKYYQFYDKTGGVKVFDVETMKEEKSLPMTCDGNLHFGSVTFSNEFSYDKNGEKVVTALPLIYATGHYNAGNGKKEIVDVIDVENNVLVRQYEFPERRDDAIAAWDFATERFWIIGYEPVNGYAETPYYINEYKFNDDGSYSEVGEVAVIEITKSTLQDCYYKDGHIYILAGWGKNSQVAEVHDYNTETKTLDYTSKSTCADEAEGFAYVPETNSFIATTWTRGGSNAYYWHVTMPYTKPYYVTLSGGMYDFDRFNAVGKDYEVYTLTLDDAADNMKMPAAVESMSAANISYSRSGVCGYNSVCLPFALTPDMLPSDEYKIYTIKSINGEDVVLQEMPEGVDAGVPCLVKAPEGVNNVEWNIMKNYAEDNAGTLYQIIDTPNNGTNLLGAFTTSTVGEGYYKLNDTGDAFVRTNSESKVYPYRCYLQLPNASAAKLRIAVDDVDAIQDITTDERVNAGIYSIDGRYMGENMQSLKKGVYVRNGKKILK